MSFVYELNDAGCIFSSTEHYMLDNNNKTAWLIQNTFRAKALFSETTDLWFPRDRTVWFVE